MKQRNRSGLRTVPCGTPDVTSHLVDLLSSLAVGGLYSFLCCLSLHNYPACRVALNELIYQRLSQSPAECRQLVFLWLLVRLLLELLIVAGFRKSVSFQTRACCQNAS